MEVARWAAITTLVAGLLISFTPAGLADHEPFLADVDRAFGFTATATTMSLFVAPLENDVGFEVRDPSSRAVVWQGNVGGPAQTVEIPDLVRGRSYRLTPDTPANVAAVASTRLMTQTDSDAEIHCSLLHEATLWRPPTQMDKVRTQRLGTSFNAWVYGDRGEFLFGVHTGTDPWTYEVHRPNALWIINGPGTEPCVGSVHFEVAGRDQSAWPPTGPLMALLFVALLAGGIWWVARRRMPRLPRKDELSEG